MKRKLALSAFCKYCQTNLAWWWSDPCRRVHSPRAPPLIRYNFFHLEIRRPPTFILPVSNCWCCTIHQPIQEIVTWRILKAGKCRENVLDFRRILTATEPKISILLFSVVVIWVRNNFSYHFPSKSKDEWNSGQQ